MSSPEAKNIEYFEHIEVNGSRFRRLCSLSTLRYDKGMRIDLGDDKTVVAFRRGTSCYVTEALCPHQHQDTIADGILEGDTVTCPMHDWCFRLSDGSEAEGRGVLKTYATHVVNDQLYIDEDSLRRPSWMDSEY